MRHRPDITDRMLEYWAGWRISLELYQGTGPSTIVRFREPSGTSFNGCRPLFAGTISRRLGALNGDLCCHLGICKINTLLVLYGVPGDDSFKARRLGTSLCHLATLRKRARGIARKHV